MGASRVRLSFYVGSGYGIKKNPPLIAVENSPVGSYRRTFTIPAHWNKRQIILYFGGVASAFYVWVNGEKVGYSQDSKTPSEFDITPYVKQGENEIAVQVFKFSDGYYLEDQDYWRLPAYSVMFMCMPGLKLMCATMKWLPILTGNTRMLTFIFCRVGQSRRR